ncbi:MAG: 4-(cytidine 5'-diphospho)-2-C-methyl-D-erythritol kinase, partial [Planctomycetota bacterium]
PFFLADGPAVCRGRGERVTPLRGLGGLSFVVVKPPVGLSTPAVYGRCQPAASPCDPTAMLRALRCGRVERAGELILNRLQPAAEALCPWIARLRDEFARCGLPGHGMSGSGSAYFGLCRSASHARRVAAGLRARNLGSVFAVQSCRG